VKTLRLALVGAGTALVVALCLRYVAAQEHPAAAGGAAAQPAAQQAFRAHDVVIVWSGGVPGAPPLPRPEAGAVDAVTQATATSGNVRQTAERLGKELEAGGRSVLVIAAEDCRDPRHIMHAKAVVLGAPDYFGLPPWQMVRFFDETLYRLYVARVRLDGRVVAAFATTDHCRAVLDGVLGSTGGKAVEGAAITPCHTSEADREAAVKKLAERILSGL